jgi:transcriptional regulator with XRE-family HTH domain
VRRQRAETTGPIERYVGARIRDRRKVLKLSQSKLGAALGVSFQQVQKYELGSNRVGAGMLFQLTRALKVPIEYFYEGYPLAENGGEALAEHRHSPSAVAFALSPEGQEFCRVILAIKDPRARRRLFEIAQIFAKEDD